MPKPGKNENKVDDVFCLLETDLKHWSRIKEAFFWDIPDCKKAEISHELVITDIEMPQNEKDPVKIRELARRTGKIIRKKIIDDKEEISEHRISI